MKLLVNVIVSAVVAIGVSYCSVMAHAQSPRPVPMAGLMCDTPAQVTRYLTQAKDAGDIDQAVLDAINKDDGSACAVLKVVGLQADRGAVITDPQGRSWQLLHVVLIGFLDGSGKAQKFDPPLNQWTAVFVRPQGTSL